MTSIKCSCLNFSHADCAKPLIVSQKFQDDQPVHRGVMAGCFNITVGAGDQFFPGWIVRENRVAQMQ